MRLLERTTHHVRLTQAGAVFLVEARQILAQVDRAGDGGAGRLANPSLRVGVVDASYDSMPQIARETQRRYRLWTFTRSRPACRHSSRCWPWAGSTLWDGPRLAPSDVASKLPRPRPLRSRVAG